MKVSNLTRVLAFTAISMIFSVNSFAKEITIISPKNASVTEQFASEELQEYLQKITGQEFKIQDSKWFTNFTITVANQANPEIKELDLGHEEYAILSVKNGLILSGGGDRGTLYAVYDFLERLGCGWYYPDEVDEIVPELSVDEVIKASANLDVIEKPDFKIRMRRYLTYDITGP